MHHELFLGLLFSHFVLVFFLFFFILNYLYVNSRVGEVTLRELAGKTNVIASNIPLPTPQSFFPSFCCGA